MIVLATPVVRYDWLYRLVHPLKVFRFKEFRIAAELLSMNHWKARMNYPAVYSDPWLVKQLERIRYMGLDELTGIDPAVFERLAAARKAETDNRGAGKPRRGESSFQLTVKRRGTR